MTFDTLYQDVLARPDDDGARSVLGDFLAEQGDPLGEFIRVQVDLAAKGPRATRALRVMEQQLLAEHAHVWHARFAPWATEVAFQRGFPALAWTTVSWLARESKGAARLPGLALVIELEFDDEGELLDGNPVLAQATHLELSRGLLFRSREVPTLDSFWGPIAQALQLRSLHLDEVHRGVDLVNLGRVPTLAQLTELSARGVRSSTGQMEQLIARLSGLKGLTTLDLSGSSLGSVAGELGDWLSKGRLRRLFLDACRFDTLHLDRLGAAAQETGGCVVSVSRNPGVSAGWAPDPAASAVVRADPDDTHFRLQPAPPQRPPLEVLGPWELLDLVGRRDDVTWYLARAGETYALLSRHAGTASSVSPQAEELALRREALTRAAHALVGLAHPNLVRWLDFGVHGVALFLARELVDAQPVRDALSSLRAGRQTMPVSEAARLGLDVCRALVALHNAGLTHGAVNELTVFQAPSGLARLLPLGLEAPVWSGAASHQYLSPEQARGAPRDARTDLFQLGALMSQCLSGQHPFARQDALATLEAVARGAPPPPLPPTVSPALRALLESLLEADPGARPQSAEEVLVELALRSHLPMTGIAEPPPPAEVDWLGRALSLARLVSLWGEPEDRRD